MKKLCEVLDRVLKSLLVFIFGLLLVVTVWQIVSRYVLASPSAFTEEVARYLLIWVSMLGAAYVFRLRMNIGLDLVTRKLSGTIKRLTERAALIAAALFAVLILIVGGARLVELTASMNQVSAVLGIEISLVYLVIPVSGVFILIYTLEQIISAGCEEAGQGGTDV